MTIDSLLAADAVTADGAVHVVSASNEPDLFWAIRGVGGNFGVVTAFEVQPSKRQDSSRATSARR